MATGFYDWSITLKKAGLWLLAGIGAGAVASPLSDLAQYILAGALSGGTFGESETAKNALWLLFTGGLTALVAGFKNWWKNAGVKLIPCLIIGAALFGASGCATMVPAVGGKTEIETSFTDTIGPDGVQNTQYNQKLKAPAGVEAKDLASMTYDWNADQSGGIAVSSDRSADTMGQAELLKAAFEANNAQINMLFGALIQAAGIASPLIGQKIDLDAAQRATDRQNDAALDQRIADIVEKVVDKKLAPKPKPATPPADSPLGEVGLPVVAP